TRDWPSSVTEHSSLTVSSLSPSSASRRTRDGSASSPSRSDVAPSDDISAYPDSLISLTVAGPPVKRPGSRGRRLEGRALRRHAEQALVRRGGLVAAHAVRDAARRGDLTCGRDGGIDPAFVGFGRRRIEP